MAPAVTWRLAAWMMSVRIPISHSTGSSGSNSPLRWPRSSTARTGASGGLQPRPQLGALQALWVDDHQAAVVTDHLPGGAQHPLQRCGGTVLVRARGLERGGYLSDRLLGECVEQRVAAGEVVVDGGSRHARPRGHLLERRCRVGGDQLGRDVEDTLGVAPGIGATARPRRET